MISQRLHMCKGELQLGSLNPFAVDYESLEKTDKDALVRWLRDGALFGEAGATGSSSGFKAL